MPQGPKNTVHLFRAFGIDVYLHWLWIVVPFFFIETSSLNYSSHLWDLANCLALFGIVLLHEFGHSLACRQVGGRANTIMLWPLGGVAYVDPPRRPGAVLWSIAAGPLVNLVLFLVLTPLLFLNHGFALRDSQSDLDSFLNSLWVTNLALLIFNMLPVYPLDGGQIVRALLWFFLGPARSLFVAVILGFVGVAGFTVYAYSQRSVWMGLITLYAFQRCVIGFKQAQKLRALEKLPRRDGYACPSCGASPPIGSFWQCHICLAKFDTFETQALCPNCRERFPETMCADCRKMSPLGIWRR